MQCTLTSETEWGSTMEAHIAMHTFIDEEIGEFVTLQSHLSSVVDVQKHVQGVVLKGVYQVPGLSEFWNKVQVIVIGNEPWFVAQDVCDVLDLTDLGKAVKLLNEDEWCTFQSIETWKHLHNTLIIDKSGFLSLIRNSIDPDEDEALMLWVLIDVSTILELINDEEGSTWIVTSGQLYTDPIRKNKQMSQERLPWQ